MVERIDQQLVRLGLVRSRRQAQDLIAAGQVSIGQGEQRIPVRRAAMRAVPDESLDVSVNALTAPVSRAGCKLEAVLCLAGWRGDQGHDRDGAHGALCLDAGQSTGGFTECLLARGAGQVIGVEVGHGQLAGSLRADPRVTCIEKTHIGQCSIDSIAAHLRLAGRRALADRLVARPGFDCIVADLSFISLRRVMPALVAMLSPQGRLFALVKPQFELGPQGVDRRGLVTDLAGREGLHGEFLRCCAQHHLTLLHWIDSPILGGDGNAEFLMHAQRRIAAQDTP